MKEDRNRFNMARGFSPRDASNFFNDEPTFGSMGKKTRPDDDFSRIPAIKSSIPELNGQAHFFTGKDDRVVIKLDREFPEVEFAAEEIYVDDNQSVLVMNSGAGYMGVTLAATNPSSNFYLYDSHLGNATLSERNAEANRNIAPNAKVISEEELDELVKQGISTVIYNPSGFTAMELIKDRVGFAHSVLAINGQLYMVTNKKNGADRHEEIVRSAMGSQVEVIGKGKGGYRVIRGVKTYAPIQERSNLKTDIAFNVLDNDYQVVTEPSLFSKNGLDIGTRALLENVNLNSYQRLLDIGCSWGAIGLVAATANPQGNVVMTDIDTRAVKVAKENIEKLGLQDRAEAIATDDISKIKGNFDLILSNPPFHIDTKELLDIFKAARDKLAKKGELHIVVEDTYLKKLQGIMEEVFGRVQLKYQDKKIKFSILSVRK